MAIVMRYGEAGERSQSEEKAEVKTLLWSTDTTQTGAFNATLSSAASNFKRIRIEYTCMSETFDPNTAIEIYMDSYPLFVNASNNPLIALGARGATYDYVRIGYFQSDYTVIRFANARRLANTGGTSTTYCMPRRIYGIN